MQATRIFDPGRPADDSLTGYKRLAQAVILSGMAAAARGDIEALDFLEDPYTAATWLEYADLPRVQVFSWIVRGCPKLPAKREAYFKGR